MTNISTERNLAKAICRDYFKDDYGRPFELTDSQADIFNAITIKRNRRVQVIAPTQYGKLIEDSVPVLTTKGWKNHGDLQIGDRLFNHLGKPVGVLAILPKGIATHEVEFTNGEKIKCHERHEWVVKSKYDLRRGYDWHVVETGEILKSSYDFSLPNVEPLNFENNGELPLDPYFLGAWLGDGSSTKPCLTLHPKDRAIAMACSYKVSTICTHKGTGIDTIYFSHNGIMAKLRECGLYNNKHIPWQYKSAPIGDRLRLLAGLIDTDGSVNKPYRKDGFRNGRVYISNTNKRLVDDTCELLVGLGLKPSVTAVKPTTTTSGIVGKKTTYYIGFAPYLPIPTILPRKKIVGLENKRHVRISSIQKLQNNVQGNCITVEGGIYLVGRHLVPTHNSDTIAMGVIVRSQIYQEEFAIVSGQQTKSDIIMQKVIKHTFDDHRLYSQLDLDTNEPLDRIKRERSKKRITWKSGGEIRTYTADARNKQAVNKSLTGFGAKNVIEDEASLIDDDLQAMVLRMLGGFPDAFLLKIGNPFYRNHFYRTWHNNNYHKIFIDYNIAMSEGRYTDQFIREMKSEPFFSVLYECHFPEEDELDPRGFRQLLRLDDLHMTEGVEIGLNLRLGCDIAEGGSNYSVYVLRGDKGARILSKNRTGDLMTQVTEIKRYIAEYKLDPSSVFVDDTGVGAGVTDRLLEMGIDITPVKVGESPQDEKFLNKKAENYWALGIWLKEGGKLEDSDEFMQLMDVKYKVDSGGRLKMESKEDLAKRGIPSPDVADALMLTFEPVYEPTVIVV